MFAASVRLLFPARSKKTIFNSFSVVHAKTKESVMTTGTNGKNNFKTKTQKKICLQPELNRRHTDLQSVALPTEL